MTTRYQKSHYEDVASILHEAKRIEVDIGRLIPAAGYADEFADLFAADNPLSCNICRAPKGETALCFGGVLGAASNPPGEHDFTGGFDPEWFLAACGVEKERGLAP